MEGPSDSSDPPQDVAVTGGTWSNTVMGTKIVDKSTVINNYSQGSVEAAKSLPQDAFQLSPGIIVYESNPISSESRIYRAKLLSKVVGDRDIVVKLLRLGGREEREAKIHFSVPYHENIVERIFTDTFKYRGQSTIYIAMECCDDQNMYDFVTSQARNKVAFDPDLYLSYAKQVADGVAFLHSHKVMNRDLKPLNLLLAKNKTVVKIADFGMCKEIKPGQDDVTLTKALPGTIGWCSPEILNSDDKIGLESDVFLLGLVFYFLWSFGKHPFGDDPHSWNHYIKHNENLNLDGLLIHDKTAAKKLIGMMLRRNPKQRPNTDQVLNEKCFKVDDKSQSRTSGQAVYNKISQRLKKLCDEGDDKEQISQLSKSIDKILQEELAELDEVDNRSTLSPLFDVSADIQEAKLPDCSEVEPPFYVVALYDFSAQSPDNLSLREEEEFLLIDKPEKDWWLLKSQKNSETGLAPANFLAAEEWYAGAISTSDAERLLMNNDNKIGTFLIRKHETSGGFVLSLLADSHDTAKRRPAHHQVNVNTEGEFSITNGKSFTNLFDLIHNNKYNRGLECQLLQSYKQKRFTFEVPRSSIVLDTLLNRGEFSEVWRGRWNDQKVAVKVLTSGKLLPAKLLREAEVMKTLCHSNVLSVLAEVSLEPIYIVTELMLCGNLTFYLMQEGTQIFKNNQISMAIQITSGMHYLGVKNYVHMDLRANNVLVTRGEMYKITGFALSRLSGERLAGDMKYPVRWTAPEIFTRRICITKSDVWSFGVLLWEIVTYGKIPYDGIPNQKLEGMLKSKYRMPPPDRCPDKFYDVMMRCWEHEPTIRPSFEHLQEEFIAMQTDGN